VFRRSGKTFTRVLARRQAQRTTSLVEWRESSGEEKRLQAGVSDRAPSHLTLKTVKMRVERLSDRFPGFQIRHQLRETRAGIWYRAYQTRVGRDVLLKAPARGDARAIAALSREVQLLGHLSGAGFVTLFDFQSEGDDPHAVYEWTGRKTLEGRAHSRRQVDVRRALDIVASLARIVRALHEQKFWLRHAGPDDFVFDGEGQIKLANLESVEPHVGKKAPKRAPLWCHPEEDGYPGDLFLLGLQFFYLITGQVPVPRKLLEDPGHALDLFARTPSNDSVLLKAMQPVLRSLLQSSSDLVLTKVIASVEEAASSRLSGRPEVWRWGSLVGAALIIGGVGGVWMWPHLRDSESESKEVPILVGQEARLAPVDSPQEVVEPPGVSEPAGGVSREPSLVVEPAEVPEIPEISEIPETPPSPGKGSEETAPETKAVSEETDVDARHVAPIPSIPAPLRARLDRYHDAVVAATEREMGGRNRRESVESQTAEQLRSDGLALVAELWHEGENPWGDAGSRETRRVITALVEIQQRLAFDRVRRSLFGASSLEFEGDALRVRYDFTSRRQLRDWKAVGEGSRVSVLDGRLFALGTVRFEPGEWLLPLLHLQLEIPGDGFDPRRPNINVSFGPRQPGNRSAPRFLFGIGTYPGGGTISGVEDGTLLAPACVVLESTGHGSWKALWTDPEPTAFRTEKIERARIEWAWSGSELRWYNGESSLVDGLVAAQLARRLEALVDRSRAGSGVDLLLQTFGSTLQIEDVEMVLEPDFERLRTTARADALDSLRPDLPGQLEALLE